MSFVEVQPPQLYQFFKLKQQNKQANIDYCPHLITACTSLQNDDIVYVIMVPKSGFLTLVTLEEGCVLAKNNVQIVYSYTYKITLLKFQKYNHNEQPYKSPAKSPSKIQTEQQSPKPQISIFLFIGFEDGTISMYTMAQNSIKPLINIFKHKPNLPKKQPLLNCLIINTDLYLIYAYSIILLKKIFQRNKQYSYHINSTPNNKKQQIIQRSINIDINSYKLNVDIDRFCHCLYVYNQYDGAVCLDLNALQQCRKIQDCIKVLKVCDRLVEGGHSRIVVTGGSDDAVKFINYHANIVDKFIGLKNYPTCIEQDEYNRILWVGNLDGTITCFSYVNKKITKKESFVMHEKRIKYNQKISQNGIKKIIVKKNLLIVFDCHHEVHFFDIIKPVPTTERDIETSNMDQHDQNSKQSLENTHQLKPQ